MIEDWIELQKICDLNMGQSPESSSYNDDEEGLPFFQGNADFGDLYPTVRKWCTEPKKVVEKDSLLISVRAPIGALNFSTEKCCIGRGLAGITIKENVNLKYVYYNLKYRSEELQNKGTGSTFKAINKGTLAETKIKNLSLQEQTKCVEILDRVNSIINLRKEELNQLDFLIKSRFNEMFGNPVSNPKQWKVLSLEDACSKLTDGTHFSPENLEMGDCKYITAKNIKLSGFDFKGLTYITKEVHDGIYSRCNPEHGDVLYIKDGATTGIAMVNSLDEEFSLLSSVALLKQNREIINGYYLCSALNNSEMYSNIRGTMGGAAITRLTITKLKQIKLPIPPIEIQNQFAHFIQQIDKLKVEIQKSLGETQILFDSLMQEYFE